MWRLQKKDVLFIAGLLGIGLEALRAWFGGEPSETLLLMYAAMIGLPWVLRADEQRSTPSSSDTRNGPTSSDGADVE